MLKNFRSYHLAVSFYRDANTVRLPAHLADQMRRAASSIVLNLAEGAGRRTVLEQRRFFNIAFASTKEVQAICDLALKADHPLIQQADVLAAHLYRLCYPR